MRILLIILLLIGILAGGYWFFFVQTYHQLTVQPGVLYRCGNRGPREFANGLRLLKPKVVVPLVDDSELADADKPEFAAELKLLKDRNIRIERVAVKLGGWPSADDLGRFIAIVQDPTNQPVLVHCAQGVRRTGMFVAAYQMSVLGMSKDQAIAAVQTFGHSDRTANDIRTFIEDYDPKTMTVSTTRPSTGRE